MGNNLTQPADELAPGAYFYQQHGDADTWHAATKDELIDRMAGPRPPAFRTVLAIRATDAEGRPTHLAGNLYFDLDGELDKTCDDFRALLAKIEALGVNPASCRLAATGGRGTHLEVPAACFIPRMPDNGIADLHLVYREMARRLAVETLDLAVYSVKRQWRGFNVRRDNGRFKIPLTPAEAKALTPETYLELCSSPRPFPELAPACLSAELMALFHDCRDKKAQTAQKQAKASAGAALLLDRCHKINAPLPPSLLAICGGLIPPREGIGFNLIGVQICTAAHHFGIDVDTLLDLCAHLIERHESDSSRYNSPAKRREAIRELFRYTQGYRLSVGGLRSILPEHFPANDLRGL